jgi:hypothetical protein
MPGVVIRNTKDRVVNTFAERNTISSLWGIYNAGIGVLVLNAHKDHPAPGLGDPSVDTPGSSAYYKWTGYAFEKVSEGESLDQIFKYTGASPSTIALGGIAAGTDLSGRTFSDILQEMLVVYLSPSFSAFAITGQALTIEIGDSIPAGNKTFTWATTNNGNIKPNAITIRNQSALVDLATPLANDGNQVVNLPTPIQLNAEGASQIFRIIGENTQNVLFQRDLTIVADYKRFYGSPAVAPVDSASVRAMVNNTFGNTFSLVIPQGNLIAAFAYEASRPDISDTSVKYVEGFNANVGNTFVKTALNVLDAGGTPRSYKLYVASLGAPYPGNATYNVTIP